MAVAVTWNSMWGQLKGFEQNALIDFGRALDGGERDGFVRWVETRSSKVQVDVLDNAPVELQEYMYNRGVLEPAAVFALEVKSKTPIIDMRLHD